LCGWIEVASIIGGNLHDVKTLDQLLADYKNGDVSAFDEFFSRTGNLLERYLFLRLRNQQDAEDATQETYLKIHRAIHRYDPSREGLAWILSIARHVAIDIFRRRQSEHKKMIEHVIATPAKIPNVADLRFELMTVLKDLTTGDVNLLVERLLFDRDFDELAKAYECKQATLRQRLHRLLATLRQS